MNGKPIFESEPCGRCGGSGQFSYNQLNGSVCFGCKGTGYRLTKRGAAAQKHLDQLRSRPVSELKVGDRILFDLTFSRCWATIESMAPSTVRIICNGVEQPAAITITGTREKTGEKIAFDARPETLVRVAFDAEKKAAQLEQALAYQAAL